MGFNQQQFSKYLNGRARPSPRSLRRIASYFDVEEASLKQDPGTFVATLWESDGGGRPDPLMDAFPGSLASLRRLVGAYATFYRSPTFPGRVVVGAAFLEDLGASIASRSIEGMHLQGSRPRQWVRGDGRAAFRGARLFVTEVERGGEGYLPMSILIPPHRYDPGLMFGRTLFVASTAEKLPVTSALLWQKFRVGGSILDLVRRTGVYDPNARAIPPQVRRYLADAGNEW